MTTFRRRAVFVSAAILAIVSLASAADLPGAGVNKGRTVVYRDIMFVYTYR